MLLKYFSLCLLLPLAACSVLPDSGKQADAGVGANAWTLTPLQPGVAPASAHLWQHYQLPGKQASEFAYTRLDGRHTMAAQANASASLFFIRN